MTRPTRYGYFGPAGTFTQMALLQWEAARGGEHAAYASVDATLAAVRSGEIDAGMVPIENSVEGGVSATLDALASGDPLVVIGEVIVPITFVLAARRPRPIADLRTIGTHTHAWAQVRGWVAANAPVAVYVPTLSTASAATDLGPDGRGTHDAAVCAPIAAELAGLTVLAHDIGDIPGASTRFVLVARSGIPARTGHDKTSIVVFQRADRPGSLLAILQEFAARSSMSGAGTEARPAGTDPDRPRNRSLHQHHALRFAISPGLQAVEVDS